MNIFISFSGEARSQYAIPILNFLNRYGLHGWYDQHELFLGDKLDSTITKNGINTSKYGILIINKTYLERNWPQEEAIRLYNNLNMNKNVIFPILLDVSKNDIKNSKLNFILDIKYQFLHTGESIEPIGFQILNRIFHDILQYYHVNTLERALYFFKRLTLSESINMYNALRAISNFDETAYREKTIFLICLIKLFNINPYGSAIQQISYLIYDNKKISFDIYKITESIFLICVSINYFNHDIDILNGN